MRYRYNNAPLDVGGRYLYLRDDDRRRLEPQLAADPARPRRLRVPPRPRLHAITARARRHRAPRRSTSCRPARRRGLADARHERAVGAGAAVAVLAVEFCLWDAHDDMTNFQRNLSTGEVEVEDGVIYHKTEYRERRDHFAFFACAEPLAGFDTRATRSSGRTAAGTGRSRSRRAGRPTRSPTAGSRSARTRSASSSRRASHARSTFVLGYAENPRDAKCDPPGAAGSDKTRARA